MRSKPKGRVESQSCLSVSELKMRGGLAEGSSYTLTWQRGAVEIGSVYVAEVTEGEMHLVYTTRQHQGLRAVFLVIRLAYTSCHLGGQRAWFCCPVCNRRCSKLYAKDGKIACRCCHQLNYACQQLSDSDWQIMRTERLMDKLDPALSVFDSCGLIAKPRYRHQRTFIRQLGLLFRQQQRMMELIFGAAP